VEIGGTSAIDRNDEMMLSVPRNALQRTVMMQANVTPMLTE
jgi:hypothetical protein